MKIAQLTAKYFFGEKYIYKSIICIPLTIFSDTSKTRQRVIFSKRWNYSENKAIIAGFSLREITVIFWLLHRRLLWENVIRLETKFHPFGSHSNHFFFYCYLLHKRKCSAFGRTEVEIYQGKGLYSVISIWKRKQMDIFE